MKIIVVFPYKKFSCKILLTFLLMTKTDRSPQLFINNINPPIKPGGENQHTNYLHFLRLSVIRTLKMGVSF